MTGPSPYDDETRGVLERTGAEGVVLVVIGGKYGHAFSVQGPVSLHLTLPELLRRAADEAAEHQQSAEFADWLAASLSSQAKQ
ncbi:MAG TPA: hypothetical protein VJS42_00615 [Steroidobacteraceae bacterium]|nr:hypothetical protein [Steroidobacteraceae bacterium]